MLCSPAISWRFDNAEAITLTGQVAIRWIERKLNEFVNKTLGTEGKDYVIASDTDSIYLNLGDLVRRASPDGVLSSERTVEILNKFSEQKIEPYIDASYKELSDYLQCYEETLVMKRECISEKGIWTSKKRYILNVWDNEGVRYSEPKLKMMGIEAVRSSTPAPIREYIGEALKVVMGGTEDDLIEFVAAKREHWESLSPEEMGFPRTANNINKFKMANPKNPLSGDMNKQVNKLADIMGPMTKRLAPLCYDIMTRDDDGDKMKCRIGTKPGRPFAGITAVNDFCAHAHRDVNNLKNGTTAIITLLKPEHRDVRKPDDEQLHVLPHYAIDTTDEFGSRIAQAEKVKSGILDIINKYDRPQIIREQKIKRQKKSTPSGYRKKFLDKYLLFFLML